jgi:putative transposase
MINFIEKEQNSHPVRSMCRILNFNRDVYYKWRSRQAKPIAKNQVKADLVNKVKAVCKRRHAYGYRRVTEQLRREQVDTNRKAVYKIMKAEGLLCRTKRAFIRTTDSKHTKRIYPNLAGTMKVTGLNQLWVGDITYIPLETGFAYLATITDAFSRKILGWALDTSMETLLCINAFKMALEDRQGKVLKGLVHHSDRGSQYACADYINLLESNFIEPSMSRKGNPYDNPIAERLFGTVKYEGVYYFEYGTFIELHAIVKGFIDDYNNQRLHSSIGYLPPNEFESNLQEDP